MNYRRIATLTGWLWIITFVTSIPARLFFYAPVLDHQGTYVVWGSARDQVDGYGNAVTPAVGAWIGARLRAVLHHEEVA